MKLPMLNPIRCLRRPVSMAGVASQKVYKQTTQPMKRRFILLTALALSAFASLVSAQTLTQSSTAPYPGPNDISYFFLTDDGLNYYDNNSTPPGQTFTTLSNAGGYTLTNLVIKTAGNGGSGETGSQTYTLSIYSVSGSTATLVTTYTATLALVQNDWLQWSGLNVALTANSQYAYTLEGSTGYEELADTNSTPYSGGQICLVPTAGGTITYGHSGTYCAAFDAGLAPGSVAAGTVALAQSATVPTPGANDVYQLNSTPSTVPAQGDTTSPLNYYSNNGTPPGQTFTTLSSPVGYVLTNLVIKTGGGGGSGETGSQTWTLRIYSVSGTTATSVTTYAATLALVQSDWVYWGGLDVPLAANTKYAYSISQATGYELLADLNTNRYYPGGSICTIPTAGGAVTVYTNNSAAFDVGLTIPQIPVPLTPAYTPTNVTGNVYAGTTVTLNETASGPAPLYYEWLTDGGTGGSLAPVGGFTTSTNLAVNTTAFTAGNTYNYAVVVSNFFGTATSSVAPLTIVAASAPTIVTDTTLTPATATNFVGLSEIFTAAIVGTMPIGYQWQVSPDGLEGDAVNISGATNATLVLNNLQLTNTGYYSLQATNAVSPFTINSTWTQLTVAPLTNEFITWSAPVPFGGLAAGQILTNTPGYFLEGAYFGPNAGPITVTVGGNAYLFYGDGSTASVGGQQGETTGAWLVGANTTGDTNLDAVLNNFAYDNEGGTTHTITLNNLLVGSNYSVQVFALDDRAAGNGRTTDFQDPNDNADFSATYGMQDNKYLVGTFTAPSTSVAIQQNLLTSSGGIAQGNINAVVVHALSYNPGGTAPTFATQPSSATAYVGRTVQFSATAAGAPVPTYQWQEGPVGGPYTNLVAGGQISGATNTTLTIASISLVNSGSEFVLIATNSAGFATSSPADLTVLAAPPLSGAYSASVLALNPVAYWPLNETSDPSVGGLGVYDASDNQHDGVYLPAALNGFDGIVGPQPADGYPQFAAGQGALQPAADTANSWANTPALNLNTNTVTIAMWLNPNGPQGNNTGLLINRNAGTVAGMTYTTGQALGYVWNNNDPGTWGYTSGPVIPQNIWSFVALVITPTNASFYVMNTNYGITTTTYPYVHTNMAWNGSSANIYLGADSSVSRVFNGVLDEPAVFNYALSASQLQALAGETTASTDPTTANFAATVTGTAGSQTFNFTWDPGHQGWQLYTNSIGLTAAGSWFPVPGSAGVTSESITINPTQTNVFFQLRYP
jgi:hypothetical protein